MTTIALICGGNGAEHDISLISADFLEQKLKAVPGFDVIRLLLDKHKFITKDGTEAFFKPGARLVLGDSRTVQIAAAVPCLHGVPGETGDIQSFFELLDIPYIGCKAEASLTCFNKVTTKLYLDALGIPNTPYVILNNFDEDNCKKAAAFFDQNPDVYVKAASQGSSIGCYHVKDQGDLKDSIAEAFAYSNEVIVEQTIEHRELEVAAFAMGDELVISTPGEIIIPQNLFYTFDEKYSKDSGTVTTVTPEGLSAEVVESIRAMARKAFLGLKLRHLSRIDFFLTSQGRILINEINTFPGMTPISMFPKLLEHMGYDMQEFLRLCIEDAVKNR